MKIFLSLLLFAIFLLEKMLDIPKMNTLLSTYGLCNKTPLNGLCNKTPLNFFGLTRSFKMMANDH